MAQRRLKTNVKVMGYTNAVGLTSIEGILFSRCKLKSVCNVLMTFVALQ